ncbi:hypothetical protein AXW67_26995 [Bradyrhizobium neotropicale]|uniref:Porin n=1 Tax=Bradyrhizobium neotropicale TaxID=1497615 RepID=A0A176YNP9_9BRAD|nr:hypothetical protein AXW67_26995 [Bradyrhizobium neotropicale]
MLKSAVIACALQAFAIGVANAAGPFGTVNTGNWIGGAFTSDETRAFSHCAATAPYANGVSLVVGPGVQVIPSSRGASSAVHLHCATSLEG